MRIGVLVVLVAAFLALQRSLFTDDPPTVFVTPVEHGVVEEILTNTRAGTVRARRRAKLSPGTSGIVVELLARRGDRVEEGDVLLRIDDREQRARVELAAGAMAVAEANHRSACLRADRAQRVFERNQDLAEKDLVSKDAIDELESAYNQAVAECDVLAAEVSYAFAGMQVAQVELDKTLLVAPFDAVIAEDSVEVGEWVTPSVALVAAPDVIDAVDPSSLYVSAPMDEVDTAQLRVGLPVRVRIDSFPDQRFAGQIVRIAPYVLDVEQQNRTLEVEVELSEVPTGVSFLPGTSADVEVVLEQKPSALRIPTHALLENSRVLVHVDGRIEERTVTTGLRNWGAVEIVDGLSTGEEVVTRHDDVDLQPGSEVVAVPDREDP